MDLFGEKRDTFYPYIYRALVIDNNDPSKFGRIKARVYPMFHELDSQFIPWSTPASSVFSGAGDGFGSFNIPAVNSYVFVFFEQGKITQPVYFAEAQTATKGIPSESSTNYPNRHVWKTGTGVCVYIDDTNNEIKIIHPSGTKVSVDQTGKVTIDSSNIQLGTSTNPLDIDSFVKVSDVTTGKILSAGSGSPVTWLPAIPHGTTKVKGV
jgi:hypothetical protein